MLAVVGRRHLRAIACPVLLVHAAREQGAAVRGHGDRACNRNLSVAEVVGLHHVHSDRPAAVAGLVLPWLRAKLGGGFGECAKL